MNLGKENETTEFKESTSEKKEAIATILNKHSRGDVYFGVFDNGDIKGQAITDSTIKDVSEMISTNI